MKTDQLMPLRADFTIEDKRPEGEYYVVSCKRCRARWSLGTKPGGVNGANVLHLLDHAAGCAGGERPTRRA
jgi:hypothetical protein